MHVKYYMFVTYPAVVSAIRRTSDKIHENPTARGYHVSILEFNIILWLQDKMNVYNAIKNCTSVYSLDQREMYCYSVPVIVYI